MRRGLLVVVPCGQKKIWDKHHVAGPTRARDAYLGAPFTVNRKFAEYFGEAWVILSAKYGFISPDFELPGPYNVTFKRKSTGPVSIVTLREQVDTFDLDRFTDVVGLGGKEYRFALEQAFHGESGKLHFPFTGLRIGIAMRETNRAIASDDPFGGGKESCS